MLIKNSNRRLPFGIKRRIRRCLKWINPCDLVGLGFIELRDRFETPSAASPQWLKDISREDRGINGVYYHDGGVSPHIALFLDDLSRGIPWIIRLTPAFTLEIAKTLAHEVGHHLIAERGFVFQPREKVAPRQFGEEMADRYSQFIVKKMKSRLIYRLADWAIRDLANWRFIRGVNEWSDGKYTLAEESWKEACRLDPDTEMPYAYWYRRAYKTTRGSATVGDVSPSAPYRDDSRTIKRLEKMLDWSKTKRQNRHAKWIMHRSKGQFHHVWTRSLAFAALILLCISLDEYLFKSTPARHNWTFLAFASLFTGLVVSMASWWKGEAGFINDSIDTRLTKLPLGKTERLEGHKPK